MSGVNYGEWTLAELKMELGKRGARKTGKKADLVKRLEFYDQNNNFGKSAQEDEHPYFIDTPSLTDYKDVNSSMTLPVLTNDAACGYLEGLNATWNDKVKNLYKERYLVYVRSATCGDKYFLHASCAAEMKKNVCYCVDVVVDKNGVIHECQCECAVGTGPTAHCKHVQCLLYGLIMFCKSNEFLTRQSCTQKLQTFNKCQSYKGSPIKTDKLNIRSKGQGRELKRMLSFDPRPQNFVKMESYQSYFNNLCINYQSTSKFKPMPSLPPANLYALCNDHDYLQDNLEDIFLKSYCVKDISQTDIHLIESKTKGQIQNKNG